MTAPRYEEFPMEVPDYRFDQKNEMFKRRTWDESFISHGNRLYGQVKFDSRPGYRKQDYALRNAAWNMEYEFAYGATCAPITGSIHGPISRTR